MSATIILHHDDPSHAAAVARGTAVTNPADLLPGDVLLSRWAPGRYMTVTAPARHFCGYLAVEYQTEDGKCGTLNVRADVNPHARRPHFTEAVPAIPADHAWRNANGIHRTDCRLDGTVRSDANPCDNCHRPWAGHTAADCGGIRFDDHDYPALRKALPEAPKMTRAHYAFLADLIADLWPGDETSNTEYVAECFADALSDTNARFDRDRFLTAAMKAL